MRTPDTAYEADGVTVRAIHGCHERSPVFDAFVRDARLVECARELLGGDVYVHQFKINTKAARTGQAWPWHQDFIFWHIEDGIPDPLLVTIMVLLDTVSESSGPLRVIPGSHQIGMVRTEPRRDADDAQAWKSDVSADLSFTLDHERIDGLITRHGTQTMCGPAGTLAVFHPNLVHSSASNHSDIDRFVVYVTYNLLENHPPSELSTRPSFLCTRSPRSLSPADPSTLHSLATAAGFLPSV